MAIRSERTRERTSAGNDIACCAHNIIARVMGEDKSINDKLMGINGELFNGLLVGISGGKPRAGRNKEFCSSHRLSLRYGTQCAKRTCLTLHVPGEGINGE